MVAEEADEAAAADPLLLVAPGNDDAGESIVLNGADVGADGRIDHHHHHRRRNNNQHDDDDTQDPSDYFESLPVLNGNGLKMEIRLDGLPTPDEQSPTASDGDRQSNNRRRRKRTPTRRNEDGDALLLAAAAAAADGTDGPAPRPPPPLRQSAGAPKRPKLEQFFNSDDKVSRCRVASSRHPHTIARKKHSRICHSVAITPPILKVFFKSHCSKGVHCFYTSRLPTAPPTAT